MFSNPFKKLFQHRGAKLGKGDPANADPAPLWEPFAELEEALSRLPSSYFTKRHTRGVMRNYHNWLGLLDAPARKKALAKLGR